jgi:hypothetical protein
MTITPPNWTYPNSGLVPGSSPASQSNANSSQAFQHLSADLPNDHDFNPVIPQSESDVFEDALTYHLFSITQPIIETETISEQTGYTRKRFHDEMADETITGLGCGTALADLSRDG